MSALKSSSCVPLSPVSSSLSAVSAVTEEAQLHRDLSLLTCFRWLIVAHLSQYMRGSCSAQAVHRSSSENVNIVGKNLVQNFTLQLNICCYKNLKIKKQKIQCCKMFGDVKQSWHSIHNPEEIFELRWQEPWRHLSSEGYCKKGSLQAL